MEVYAQLERAIAKWEPVRREAFLLNSSRIVALYSAGRIDAGIAAAEALVKRQVARVGEGHFDTASARGTLAIGYARAGRAADAIREFKLALPPIIAAARDNSDDDDSTSIAASGQMLQTIVEAYIGLLSRNRNRGGDVAIETFALADAVRGRSVQQALAASSARMTAKDAALAELVRKEQDLASRSRRHWERSTTCSRCRPLNATRPASARSTQRSYNYARTGRRPATRSTDASRRMPTWLTRSHQRSSRSRATLRPDEALLSFYFGRDASFVWAVPKRGPVAFAAIAATRPISRPKSGGCARRSSRRRR